MAGAAYECLIEMTSAETLLFTIKPRDAAGAAPNWSDYELTYRLWGCGADLSLTEGDGIEIDEVEDTVTIGPANRSYRLAAGQYQHGFLMKQISSGVTVQDFDGTITVTQGPR